MFDLLAKAILVHSKLKPVNSQHSKTLPNMLKNK